MTKKDSSCRAPLGEKKTPLSLSVSESGESVPFSLVYSGALDGEEDGIGPGIEFWIVEGSLVNIVEGDVDGMLEG